MADSSPLARVPALSAACATLDSDRRKARYGVAYVRSICAQAGVNLQETSPDEDVLAVDCDIKFRKGPVSAQIKCTSQLKIHGRSASWPVESKWVNKWKLSLLPVYFVIVIVPDEVAEWIEHDPAEGTFHRAAAFWRRIRPDEQIGTRLSIPKDQRFQASTLDAWYSDLLATFDHVGGRP